jgi:hypothetical protein
VIITASEYSLQRLHYLYKISSAYNLTISTAKTKVLAVKGKELIRAKIVINNSIIEQETKCNDLGCQLSSNRNYDQQNRLQRFNYLCGKIKSILLNRPQQETFLKFYKVLAVTSLIYGSECWTLNKQLLQIESSEMRFLRSVAGYRRTDKI